MRGASPGPTGAGRRDAGRRSHRGRVTGTDARLAARGRFSAAPRSTREVALPPALLLFGRRRLGGRRRARRGRLLERDPDRSGRRRNLVRLGQRQVARFGERQVVRAAGLELERDRRRAPGAAARADLTARRVALDRHRDRLLGGAGAGRPPLVGLGRRRWFFVGGAVGLGILAGRDGAPDEKPTAAAET